MHKYILGIAFLFAGQVYAATLPSSNPTMEEQVRVVREMQKRLGNVAGDFVKSNPGAYLAFLCGEISLDEALGRYVQDRGKRELEAELKGLPEGLRRQIVSNAHVVLYEYLSDAKDRFEALDVSGAVKASLKRKCQKAKEQRSELQSVFFGRAK